MRDEYQQEQIARNVRARGEWEHYATHRQRILALIESFPTNQPAARIACLGAGNCNDLDLQALVQRFSEVQLFDLDETALLSGVASQGLSGDPRIIVHGQVDVVGSSWPENESNPTSVHSKADWLARLSVVPQLGMSGEFDVVVSAGLLTQLIEGLLQRYPQDKAADLPEILAALRRQHVALLCDLARPGGRCWLTVEVVASDSCPALRTCSDADLPRVIGQALQQRNFFSGCHPGAIQEQLRNDPALRPRIQQLITPAPWRWQFFERMYAVVPFGWEVAEST